MKAIVQVIGVDKRYPRDRKKALMGVSFEVLEGRIVALVGESGSGKTTMLRVLAGMEGIDAGEVRIDGVAVTRPAGKVPPEARSVGFVFQHHALFPHLNVADNIGFGLRHLPAATRRRRVTELLATVNLTGKEQRFAHELSGGERQRVALARALAPEPRVLLLDEPFSSLDVRLRQQMRDETQHILRERGTTAVFVTHDTDDALAIADRIVVLRDGMVQQVGAPPEVYHAPINAYVARFFGACNILPFGSLNDTSGAKVACHIGPPGSEGQAGLWVRPEDLELVRAEGSCLRGRVVKVVFGGGWQDVYLLCEGPEGGQPVAVEVRHLAPFVVAEGEIWGVVPKPKRRV